MTSAALQDRARALRSDRVAFVHAMVVLAEKPTSAKPGDEALVLPDGSIEGFVGGQCAESTVSSQGLSLLASGDSMLLRIAPNAEGEQPGKTVVHNPCLSGGTLEIFMEPILPAPLVAVLGDSPTARALVALAASLGFETKALDVGALESADALVVATHGKGEEEALVASVRAEVPYVGLIASPKRGAAVVGSLDLSDEERARIHTPAGLDIGARTPAEIALSVFAQVIAERPQERQAPRSVTSATASNTVGEVSTGVDPVCGMTVTVDDDALYADVGGDRIYFCCPACRRAYLKEPERYPRT
ncbi:MAG TPA: XdhC family protein [Actinomycetes bacterium]|nr:XdhC family protein [Actinomycetes bacterium]